MGMKSDMNTRERERVDDIQRQQNIETAHTLIFDKGLSVGSDQIKTLLDDRSLVPTWVSLMVPYWLHWH